MTIKIQILPDLELRAAHVVNESSEQLSTILPSNSTISL